jgi:outer membrane receptor protein involved in Fe transport
MLFNLAYWNLYLEQEFVYVGDAGIVEPSGKTFRQGVDLSYRYQPFSWLYWNFDANYTYARATEEASTENFIPLAPDFTLVSGINILHPSGWYGTIDFRYLDNRPANENNTIVAKGYGITDLNLGYKKNKFNVGIQVQNLFNSEWNETQFATESRLFNETEPTEEIHFTPGTPFFLRTMISFYF